MRVALGVSYLGQHYAGWQIQRDVPTVQACLESALGRLADQPIQTYCAGRTDAGVHGLNQVVHFDTLVERRDFSWIRGTNAYLPPDIAVQWCRFVPNEFHARNSAVGRRYIYLLLEGPVRPALEHGRVGWKIAALNGPAMQAAAQYLIGEHDFSSFRSIQCQARSPIKQLRHLKIQRHGAYWRFEFEGSAFLHHMIRNIMGCLLAIGSGQHPPAWMQCVLKEKNRDAAAPTFMPDGLYFVGPTYAPAFELPTTTAALQWLPGSI